MAWEGFERMYTELGAQAPAVASELERIQVSKEQKNAILDVLALLIRPTVQSLGFNIATIIRTSAYATEKYLKFIIEDKLEPIEDIRGWARLIIPKSMLAVWSKVGHDWELTLNPQNIRSMRTEHVKLVDDGTHMDLKTKSLSIHAGVLLEGSVLLEIMKSYLNVTGPPWSTDERGTTEIVFNSISLPTQTDKLAFYEAFLWPLKCAVQGLDALRASVSPNFGHDFNSSQESLDALEASVSQEDKIKNRTEGLDVLRAQFSS